MPAANKNNIMDKLGSRYGSSGFNPSPGKSGENDYSNSETFPSLPVISFDIPEPKSFSAKFIYNYFRKDEKTNRKGNVRIVNMSDTTKEEREFYSKNSLPPRYSEIDLTPPSEEKKTNAGSFQQSFIDKFVSSDMAKDLLMRLGKVSQKSWNEEKISEKDSILNETGHNQKNYNIIKENIDKIINEDVVSNAMFSSFIIRDTQAHKKFYNVLSGSMIVKRVDHESNHSGNEQGEMLATSIKSKSVTGESKRMIVETLSNLQSAGVKYIDGEGNEIEQDPTLSPVRALSWNVKINDLYVNDMIRVAMNDSVNVYEDELRGAHSGGWTKRKQDNRISTSNPNQINESEYEMFLASSNVLAMSSAPGSALSNTKFKQTHLGYVIEKTELDVLDNFSILSPIIVTNKYQTKVIDEQIKYGATYTYRVRSIVLTEFNAIARDPRGLKDDQLVKAGILIASQGIQSIVECDEKVPPPPPADLRFIYNYQNNNLLISWNFPLNLQRDIKKFQIFRRRRIEDPFTLLSQYDFDDSEIKSPTRENAGNMNTKMKKPQSIFIDTDFNMNSRFIYSVCCIDARNLTSNYSTQFEISFNRKKNKIERKMISRSGAAKSFPNMFLNKDLFIDTLKDSGHKRMTLVFDPEYYAVKKKNKDNEKEEITMKTYSVNPDEPTYLLQIINTDMQDMVTIPITIEDISGLPVAVPAVDITKF